MLIDLVPDFLAVLRSAEPFAAYLRYFAAYRRILEPYWRNYVVDPDSPHFAEAVRTALAAPRTDLAAMLERVDVAALAREAAHRSLGLLESDTDIDAVLMVGVGAANAGELVTEGRGIAVVCLEHFTGVANPETHGLGLDPELIPLWLAHEIAHAVRYTSPTSRCLLRQLIGAAGGSYSVWDIGRRAPLRELVVNEGLAVEVARAVSPGHADWEYYGYRRRQYVRIRELEPAISRQLDQELDDCGIGLRLRYLSDGMSAEARRMDHGTLPERAGYFIGSRMVRPAIASRGFPWAIRASAAELSDSADAAPVSA